MAEQQPSQEHPKLPLAVNPTEMAPPVVNALHESDTTVQMDEVYLPPPEAVNSAKKPEEENWLNAQLVAELATLPKPDNEVDTLQELDRKFKVVFAALAKVRPFYNIYQFWQFVAKAMLPFGYEVKLSTDRRFVHCLPDSVACAVSPYDIHFNFPKKTYQLSRARPECASNTSEKMELYAQKRKAVAIANAAVASATGQPMKKPRETTSKTLFDVQWNTLYERLKQYREKYGNCCVPTRGFKDPQLAKWVSRQREYFNKGSLSQERVDLLNQLDFKWRLKDKDTGKSSCTTWEKNFSRLKAYRAKYGNTHVPTRGFDDPQLAKWVSRQREYYNKNVLSKTRIEKLNSLDFTWQLKAGGPKKKRNGNLKESNTAPTDSNKPTHEKNGEKLGIDETKKVVGENKESGAENEVAALLTNLRRRS